MSRLVESLKRLYESGKRSKDDILTITSVSTEELEYILGEELESDY